LDFEEGTATGMPGKHRRANNCFFVITGVILIRGHDIFFIRAQEMSKPSRPDNCFTIGRFSLIAAGKMHELIILACNDYFSAYSLPYAGNRKRTAFTGGGGR
jgi:hypothetical protein